MNPLDYPRLVQDALRGVVRRSLTHVQSNGLPGEHHFYLAFSTVAPGVSISEDLRRRYPEQITIVLQHDFRDLDVDDEFFAVTLRFGGIPQRIRVPFSALISFYDPASQFALRFEPEADGEDAEAGSQSLEDTSSRAAVRAVLAAADRLAAAKEAALRELDENGESMAGDQDAQTLDAAPSEAQDSAGSETKSSNDQDSADGSPLPHRPQPLRRTPKPRPAPGTKTADTATKSETAGEPKAEPPLSDNVVSIESFRRK